MLDSKSAPPASLRTPLTDAIVKHRNIFWGILVGTYAFAFNGVWRVGRDSALYRGLAHSLATGKGYTFGDFGSRQIYPGLPVLLAGLEKIFGPSALPPIIVIHLFALGCLVFTYKLVRLRFDRWLAVIVTFCVGINGWFLELANEIRDDIPFLFGMLVALYGWERLRLVIINGSPGKTSRVIVKSLIYLLVGLAIAAVMRPTFWILAVAWVMVCGIGLITGPRRRFYAICLVLLMVVWLAMALADPRTRGFKPFAGGYEHDARVALGEGVHNVKTNTPRMLEREFAYGVFGQQYFTGATELLSALAIVASLILLRHNPLWTLVVLLTVAVTLVMTPVPRYYVMIVPLLMLAWLLMTSAIAQRVSVKWADIVLVLGIAFLVGTNFARCCKVIGEQRGWHQRGGEESPKWQYIIEMGDLVKQLVPPGEKVIAPGASIMSYYSEREVVMARDILPKSKPEVHWPRHIAALNIHYAVFPSDQYKEGERKIRELMDKGVIVPTERVGKVGELVLAKVKIEVPEEGKDWRKRPVAATRVTGKTTVAGTTRPSTQALAKKRRHQATARRAIAQAKAIKLAKAEHRERMERQKRKQIAAAHEAKLRREAKARKARHAARRAATRPATTKPTTQPSAFLLLLPVHGERAGERAGERGWVFSNQRNRPLACSLPLSLTLAPPAGRRNVARHLLLGGFSGQSSAFLSFSICSRENFRGPTSIPWQRLLADFQFSFESRFPSQNGHVLHCSGRTS